jgi:hypothetical protein
MPQTNNPAWALLTFVIGLLSGISPNGNDSQPHRLIKSKQTGVGTYSPPGMLTSAGLAIASKLDEAVAWLVFFILFN